MKNSTRILSAFLAAMTLACVSCGGSGTTEETTASQSTESTTAAPVGYQPPKVDFGGEELNVFLWDQNTVIATEENGDIVNDAVFKRNRKIEDEYNLTFSFNSTVGHGDGWGTWASTINAAVMADDGSIDLVGGYTYRLATESLNGYYHNLKAIDNINFGESHWMSNLAEACDIGGKLYIALGNIEPGFYNVTNCYYFNKNLAEDYKIESPYELVKSGKWTIDKLAELSRIGAKDVNGDATWGDEDQFGSILPTAMQIDAFVNAFDIKITENDAKGIPQLLALSERYVDGQKKVQAYAKSAENYYGSGVVAIFKAGRGLFLAADFNSANNLRDMKDDFGILPYPKLDEEQEKYIGCNSSGNATGYCIPITADAEKVGAVLEAMAYYGYTDILPEYYERSLKIKGTRDNDSEAMLDLIFNGIEFSFTEFYSFAFGDQKSPYMLMRVAVAKDGDIASMFESNKELNEATMETLISSLK